MQRTLVTTTLVLALPMMMVLGGCVHKPDIQQGNLVTPDMRDQLREGMSADQVRRVAGSPMLVDPFQPRKWVYAYRYRRDGDSAADHTLTVRFDEAGKVATIQGEAPPEGRHRELVRGSEARTTPTDPGEPVAPTGPGGGGGGGGGGSPQPGGGGGSPQPGGGGGSPQPGGGGSMPAPGTP
ncbi:MAG: outer membrane protein assembly factor BamE [Thiohalospira sp.]